MVKVKEDLTGRRFGRLTVLYRAADKVQNNGAILPQWHCKCDCGNETDVLQVTLKTGGTKSCGCLRKETAYHTLKRYNQFKLNDTYGTGYTSKGEEFYFDIEDYDKIKNICWNIDAYGYVSSGGRKGKMHNYIMPKREGYVIDHINHNRTDNRKRNLRYCTENENGQNHKIMSRNTSGVTGVSWDKRDGIWVAQLTENHNYHYLGRYVNFEDAVQARKKAEEKYFGQYSYDNSMKIAKEYDNV